MEKIKQYLQGTGTAFADQVERAIADLYQRQALNSAGLAVNGAANPAYKVANTVLAMVGGTLVSKTTAAFPALTGYNLTSAQVGLIVAAMDVSGNLVNIFANPAASIGQLSLPPVPPNYVCLGVVLINIAATFTGGTTAMDTAGITYVSQVGPFNPLNLF
jgi:hypothetical protein